MGTRAYPANNEGERRVISISAQRPPTVSIIIPTYCEAATIGNCLQSIQRQQLEKGLDPVETIIVDSNSPDATQTIAQHYATRVITTTARGVSKARNLGARAAHGRLLLFLDADTVLDPHFVTRVHASFHNPTVVCISGALRGLENLSLHDTLFKVFHYGLVNLIAAVSARIGVPLFPTVCCACRRSAFHQAGGFDEGLAIAEDLKFSIKMGKIGKCQVNYKAKAYTSLRRVQKNGRLKNYFLYFKNYFRVFVLHQKPWIRDFPHTAES